jgi:hypothetical protein
MCSGAECETDGIAAVLRSNALTRSLVSHGGNDTKKGRLTPLVQNVIYSLLRFGRSFDDELFVIAKLLQPALNVGGRILKRLIIQDACMIVQKCRANFSNKFFF